MFSINKLSIKYKLMLATAAASVAGLLLGAFVVAGYMHMVNRFAEPQYHLNSYLLLMLGAALLVLIVIFLLSHALQKIIAKPLLALAETVEKIGAEKDYSLRAEKLSNDEIGQLVTAFNRMINTIEAQNVEILGNNDNLEKIIAYRTAELRELNRELEAFSYSVAHDLRQPLRAIDGFSLAILEDCGGLLDDAGKSYLARVRAASQRMGVLIDSMLNLSRVMLHEMAIADVDISSIVRDIASQFLEHSPQRDVRFDIQPGLMVRGDERMLRIALENLIGNAWKFTGRTPEARVSFGVQLDAAGESIYYVKDNGAGFDMRYAERLFHAFHRLHSVQEFEGTGIGLATVYRVINRHRGKVWATAHVNSGATLFFTLGQNEQREVKE